MNAPNMHLRPQGGSRPLATALRWLCRVAGVACAGMLVVSGALAQEVSKTSGVTGPFGPPRRAVHEDEWKAVLPSSWYPISQKGEKGLEGFAVDVLKSAGLVRNLKIKTEARDGEVTVKGLVPPRSFEGPPQRVDADIQLVLLHKGDPPPELYTKLYIVELDGAVFAREDDLKKYPNADAVFAAKPRVAVVNEWDRAYAVRKGIPENKVEVLAADKVFAKLYDGERDVVFMPRLVGASLLRDQRRNNLRQACRLTPDYTARLHFSVSPSVPGLLPLLEKALERLGQDGDMLAVHNRWFSAFETTSSIRLQLANAALLILVLLFVVSLAAFLYQRSMRRRLAHKTGELQRNGVILAAAQQMAGLGHWHRTLEENAGIVCSAELCRILGIEPDADGKKSLGLDAFLALVPEPERPGLSQAIASAGQSDRPITLSHKVLRANGGERHVEHCVQLVTHEKTGAPFCIVGTVRDVTEHKLEEDARRHQESVLREAGQIAKVGGWSFDPASGEGEWTPEVARIHELPPTEITSRDMGLSFFQGENRAIIEAAIKEAQESGTPYDLELELITAKGNQRWVRTICNPVIENGRVVRLRGCIQDITDRKASEAVIKQNDRLLSKLSARVPGLIYKFQLSPDGRLSMPFASQGLMELVEISPEAVREDASPAFDIIHPDDKAVVQGAILESARTLTRFRSEYRVIIPNKGLRWHRADSQPERLADGTVVWHGYISDITESKDNEARIAEQADFLDKARDAIIVRGLDHKIRYWNQGAFTLYGWAENEVKGRAINELIYDSPTAFEEANRIVLERGEWTGEIEQVTRNGRAIIVEGRWTLMRDAAGRPASVLAINTDITEKKRLETRFLRSQRLESIGTLASGVAHDLNNVLAPVTLAVSLLRAKVDDPVTLKTLDIIDTSVRRGASVVKQITGFARGTTVDRVPLQLETLVAEQVETCRRTFPAAISVCHVPLPHTWTLQGDAMQLEQVISQLCLNARDAMPGGGTLSLSLSNLWMEDEALIHHPGAKAGAYVRLEVADTGSGIPADILPRIFDPFFTSKDIGRGSGLGLSTVHSIVRGHGGFIDVTSQVGRGTVFHIYLPASEMEPAESGLSGDGSPAAPGGRGETILLADDEAPLRLLVQELLTSAGYKVLIAADGIEAVAIYEQERASIALLITDMAMPRLGGEGLIRAIRRLSPSLPVIAISGNRDPSSIAQIAPNLNFLAKPFASEALLRLVAQALPATPGASDPLPAIPPGE